MARPKVAVSGIPRPTEPSPTDRLPGEGQQAIVTVLRPFTGSVKKENEDLKMPSTATIDQAHVGLNLPDAPRTQPPPVQMKTEQNYGFTTVKTEQNCSPVLGEKLPIQTPVSATISSAVPAAEGPQATAPAMWPSNRQEHGLSPRGRTTPVDEMQPALVEERNQNRSSRKPRAERFNLSLEDLVSDSHLLLREKAEKLNVSVTLFKNRRRAAGLGRWPGRSVRSQLKRAQTQAHA